MKQTLLICLAFVATTFFMSFAPDDNGSATGYKPGDVAMNFTLKNVDGKMVSLSDYASSKGVLVVFTCNHCPYSVAYENRIIELHNKYAAKGYPVVAINPNDAVAYPADSYENMIERAQEKNFPFAYLHDESQQIAKTYGATRTPHIYLLTQKNKQFTVAYVGAIDDNSNEEENVHKKYVQDAISDLEAGRAIATPSTKAIGCSIKWKK